MSDAPSSEIPRIHIHTIAPTRGEFFERVANRNLPPRPFWLVIDNDDYLIRDEDLRRLMIDLMMAYNIEEHFKEESQ